VTRIAADPDHAEISAAERWELIERVLGSQEFKRAQRLRELLQYIGTQAVKSGANSIHEQEIGRAVFGRSGEYDTSLDNIVRVNVTELRNALDTTSRLRERTRRFWLEFLAAPTFPSSAAVRPIMG